jgi:hypothetical protein
MDRSKLDQISTHKTGLDCLTMQGNPPVPPLCPDCRKPMKLVRTIPRLGALPEMFGFYCASCHQAETIEHRED